MTLAIIGLQGQCTPACKTFFRRLFFQVDLFFALQEFTSAVIHETLRFCPAVVRLAKMVQKDTILEARRFSTLADGRISDVRGVAVPIQKGGMCVVDIMGVHMNREWGIPIR